MLLSAVPVLVVAQSSLEIPEGLINNPVYLTHLIYTSKSYYITAWHKNISHMISRHTYYSPRAIISKHDYDQNDFKYENVNSVWILSILPTTKLTEKKKSTEHKMCASLSVNIHFNKYLVNYTSDMHSVHKSTYKVALKSVRYKWKVKCIENFSWNSLQI